MRRQSWFRLTAVVVSILLALLIVYLALPELLRLRFPGAGPGEMSDAERRALAAKTEGIFALDEDPLVGIRMKGALQGRRILDGEVHTDDYGMRRRPGPEPQEGVSRIVLLGDSVAFGFGLDDDEAMGHRLELHLGAATPPGAAPPVVFTVACPGWSLRNSTRYLQSRLASIDPDIVLFMPVENDLHDGYGVNEVGHRSLLFDPAVGGASPHVSLDAYWGIFNAMTKRVARERLVALAVGGGVTAIPHAIVAGVTPESQRRWRNALGALRELDARLRARDAHLAVVTLWSKDFERHFIQRIRESEPSIRCLPLFADGPQARDRLETDPHPNAETADAAGRFLAEALVDWGWVEGRKDALAGLPEAYASRRVTLEALEDGRRWLEERRATWSRYTSSEIDLDTTVGFHQIYGGVRPDLSVGRGFACGLRRAGNQLVLLIDRIPADRGLYPLDLEILVDGARVARMPVTPPEGSDLASELSVALPAECHDREFLDVTVRPTNWIAETHLGRSRMTSFYLRRIAAE